MREAIADSKEDLDTGVLMMQDIDDVEQDDVDRVSTKKKKTGTKKSSDKKS